ncbi:uncharacterized protein LOC120633268 [Pararge aegeria]|uniref:uncharacterized protein LOC120633268 n=1 Tax=Pararge aegeria TaxID=116150 RepID=UPI0019CF7BAD|nr:uncharacterized protein LOC120633268 [Pararge aegeria]
MSKLSEHYYLRNHYLEAEKVPTQTIMKEKMTPPLANIYFKSMTPKLRLLAGLEPPMKGGGSDWFIPPDEVLKGRAVMKPIKKSYLAKLGFNGIDSFGDKLVKDHHKAMEEEKRRLLLESDSKWKATVEASCSRQRDETSREQAKQNTAKIQQAFKEFSMLYSKSLTSIETLLLDAAVKEIERVEEETFNIKSKQYAELLKQQATMLYDRYTIKMFKEKTEQKDQFISTVEKARTELGNKLHDINVEKHVAIDRLRVLLECQNLACQVYVALKEREEFKQQIELSKHEHKKTVKILSEQMQMQDFEVQLAKEKEEKRQDFIKMWKKKICHVIKKFQIFVKYCLNNLPEHAEFFLNMEKLMLLQLSEATENPTFDSIFVPEKTVLDTPEPKPHPFFLFCDKGYKPKLNQDLCPKHCTSSASQLPVIVVNKRYIYAACDNVETFTEKVKEFLAGYRGDDDDLIDDHDYTFDIPIKCRSSDQLLELKLESSLMQVLQNELMITEHVKVRCMCNKPNCTCEHRTEKISAIAPTQNTVETESTEPKDYGQEITSRTEELEHEREPKWERYLDYLIPRRCKCAKRAKKHLQDHLPACMRNISPFDVPELPNYITCSVDKLRKLVKSAQRFPSSSPTAQIEAKTRDKGTQYSDQEFDFLCTCFSEEEIEKLFHNVLKGSKLLAQDQETKFTVVDGSLSHSYLKKSGSSFVQDRAQSLKNLVKAAPELQEIFKKNDCDF